MNETVTPAVAAETIGVSDGMLRALASPRYYAEFLDAKKDDRGHRMYNQRDLAILQYVKHAERRGLSHRQIRENLRVRGVDNCLREELGAEGTHQVLQSQVERLRNERSELLDQKRIWDQERDRLRNSLHQAREFVARFAIDYHAASSAFEYVDADLDAVADRLGRLQRQWWNPFVVLASLEAIRTGLGSIRMHRAAGCAALQRLTVEPLRNAVRLPSLPSVSVTVTPDNEPTAL